MSIPQPQVEESSGEGSPLWMVSFSDCMTLLMSFFLVLATFSSSGDKGAFKEGSENPGANKPSLNDGKRASGDGVTMKTPAGREPASGSETMTQAALAGQVTPGGKKNPKDPKAYSHRVFLIDSQELFFGRSDILTAVGKEKLKLIAAFLARVPGRMVISETGPGQEAQMAGLSRAIAVMQFLRSECSLEGDRMSVSMTGTASQQTRKNGRRAEIALLERGAYK